MNKKKTKPGRLLADVALLAVYTVICTMITVAAVPICVWNRARGLIRWKELKDE